MKVLIIGSAGFVGGHLADYLSLRPAVEVFASKLGTEKLEATHIAERNIYDLDILQIDEVEKILKEICPDYIIHLAAQSSVSYSWKEPALTFNVNLIGTINILEAIRKADIAARILLIGSAEEYGGVGPEELPINENRDIDPNNPYAISKAAQEMTARMYVSSYNMEIVMVRAFNHIGPGQSPVFAIPDFAKQIAEIEKGMREPVILVGNLDAKRDFCDVRDIVRGYWELVQNGMKGEIYNIGSGTSYSIKSLLDKMIGMSSKKIDVQVDMNKFRPADIPELRADISKIRDHIRWQPEIGLDKTLSDILNYWRVKC